jgi:hypothetical protein
VTKTNEHNHAQYIPDPLYENAFTITELFRYVDGLARRVAYLEQELGTMRKENAQSEFAGLRKLEYKIGRLYVKELTGTLNIGITTFGNGDIEPDLTRFPMENEGLSEEFEESNHWFDLTDSPSGE